MNALLTPRTVRPETQLLVVEAAATPLLHLARRALRPQDTWTLAAPAGKLGELANALATRRDSLRTAALLFTPTASRSDHELLQRTRVARLLLQHLVASGTGELVFVTSASARREARQEVLALIDVFLTDLGDVPLVLSARFMAAPGAAFMFGAQRAAGMRLQHAEPAA